jgi:hypothetical protein
MYGGALSSSAMCFVAHGVDAAGVNPPVVEVEQSTHSDGVINGFVREARVVQDGYIGSTNGHRVAVNFVDETEQGFVGSAQFRCFHVGDDACHQLLIVQ